jgi:hypothetical protein
LTRSLPIVGAPIAQEPIVGPLAGERTAAAAIAVFAARVEDREHARAFASALAAALDRPYTESEIAPTDRVVVLGLEPIAALAPRLVIAITGGLPEAAWTPSARAWRDLVDLRLSDHRPELARRLAHEIEARVADGGTRA